MLIKSLTLTLLFCLSGCLGPKPSAKYSSKSYEVKNSLGRHKYHPQKGYRLSWKHSSGFASYYGGKFNGRKTSGCVIFDENQLTAAHPTAIIPSIAKVTRADNGHSIYVVITDRGPFAKNRICDLSVSAARKLGFIKQGHIKVKIHVLEEESKLLGHYWKKFVGKKLPNGLFKHISSKSALQRYLRMV